MPETSRCPACAGAIPPGGRFCPACGEPIDASLTPTRVARAAAPAPAPGPSAEGRFIPGAVLAGRYRIVGLIGRGGMGEVYRADDLKLGQPVSLKLLPEALERDARRLARFHNEVRVARQVSHPNVCRVHDIGEIDGHHFLTMEYVDGEDLASLRRRIGRLPGDKAVEIARQICAGLAAAHDAGILHRDLKPANVMIDGRGRAKIADFGLAALAGEIGGAEVRAGTPAYMAPEQIAGRDVTVRSDLYALGLVLYELFTGKRAFEAASLEELARLHTESRPTNPGKHVPDLDPAVERAILRCLEKDPGERPPTALAVAAALPGGDPLAAALAAGETPSPEMVAAAGEPGAMRPAAAVACLAACLGCLAAAPFVFPESTVFGLVPKGKSSQVLADRAREIAMKLGYVEEPVDRAYGFDYDGRYLDLLEDDPSPDRWERLRTGPPAAVRFWYRESPGLLVSRGKGGGISPEDPPATAPGMLAAALDVKGRLLAFSARPPAADPAAGASPDAGWSTLLREAGLDPAGLDPAAPSGVPPSYADSRAAWRGAYPGHPETPIRVEAASLGGRPVHFEIAGPWAEEPLQQEGPPGVVWENRPATYATALIAALYATAAVLTRRNLRAGRGDRRGAFRIAAVVFVLRGLTWIFTASHVPSPSIEWELLDMALARCLWFAASVWLFYVALEPYVRRQWPETLISWSRLLSGRLRDPRVGRDLLVGVTAGTATHALGWVFPALTVALGAPAVAPLRLPLNGLMGAGALAGEIARNLWVAVYGAMFFLLLLLVVHLACGKRKWLTGAAIMAVFAPIPVLMAGGTFSPPSLALGAIMAAVIAFVAIQFGLLALLTMTSVLRLFILAPLTADPSAWYIGGSVTTLLLIAAVAAYGFRTALAGRPVLAGAGLGD